MAFHKAERSKAKLRLALCGVSGSGKTYSALLIAQGLGGKIAMIDTENRSGELYAKLCDYDACQITASFTPDKYITAIEEAEKAGYNVIIIDSLSHAWAGEGGLLDRHDAISQDSRSGNSYMAWRKITPLHNKLVNAILQSPCHIIATMRSKTAYEIVDDGNGKKAPRKIGMAPVQRDGMEYEFTVVLDLSVDSHIASSSKDRTGIFDGQYFKPTVETGKQLLSWLEDGDAEWQPLKKDDPEETEKPRPEKSAPRRKAPEPETANATNAGLMAYTALIKAIRAHSPELAMEENVAMLRTEAYAIVSEVVGHEVVGTDSLRELTSDQAAGIMVELRNIPERMRLRAA